MLRQFSHGVVDPAVRTEGLTRVAVARHPRYAVFLQQRGELCDGEARVERWLAGRCSTRARSSCWMCPSCRSNSSGSSSGAKGSTICPGEHDDFPNAAAGALVVVSMPLVELTPEHFAQPDDAARVQALEEHLAELEAQAISPYHRPYY